MIARRNRISIVSTIVFTLVTVIADIVEIVKIARKRMPLALYIDFTAKKTGFYAVYVPVGLIFGKRIMIVMGGVMWYVSLSISPLLLPTTLLYSPVRLPLEEIRVCLPAFTE